jgi:hypothetical protein
LTTSRLLGDTARRSAVAFDGMKMKVAIQPDAEPEIQALLSTPGAAQL